MEHNKKIRTLAEREEIYARAIVRWGEDAQLNIVVEEFAELTHAISKWRRSGSKDVPEKLIEELADADVMMEQVKLLCKNRGVHDIQLRVDNVKDEKLTKLSTILAGGSHGDEHTRHH